MIALATQRTSKSEIKTNKQSNDNITCEKCGKSCFNKSALLKHMTIKHKPSDHKSQKVKNSQFMEQI